MDKKAYDVAIIGGGPAGLAAAIAAADENVSVVIIERDSSLGGILNQCIHSGFGLNYFKEELTGPEYADRFIKELKKRNVDIMLNAMVLSVDSKNSAIHLISPQKGSIILNVRAVVLAMGCRERTRMALSIPGTRPAGIFTAGTAQRFINIQNYMVGKKIAILGSGDIGMIMARRLTLENASVIGVFEIMHYLTGLTRNKVQCLDDFDIPLFLGHTITDIKGEGRVSSITVAQVDESKKPISETAKSFDCDTVLISAGLIPENELSKKAGVAINPLTGGAFVNQYLQTSEKNIFACGNVLHVNDLVDNVSEESLTAGRSAALFALNKLPASGQITVKIKGNVRYAIPNTIESNFYKDSFTLYARVCEPMSDVVFSAAIEGKVISKKKIAKVNPGEMNNLKIDMKKLPACAGSELVVAIEKGSEFHGRTQG